MGKYEFYKQSCPGYTRSQLRKSVRFPSVLRAAVRQATVLRHQRMFPLCMRFPVLFWPKVYELIHKYSRADCAADFC